MIEKMRNSRYRWLYDFIIEQIQRGKNPIYISAQFDKHGNQRSMLANLHRWFDAYSADFGVSSIDIRYQTTMPDAAQFEIWINSKAPHTYRGGTGKRNRIDISKKILDLFPEGICQFDWKSVGYKSSPSALNSIHNYYLRHKDPLFNYTFHSHKNEIWVKKVKREI